MPAIFLVVALVMSLAGACQANEPFLNSHNGLDQAYFSVWVDSSEGRQVETMIELDPLLKEVCAEGEKVAFTFHDRAQNWHMAALLRRRLLHGGLQARDIALCALPDKLAAEEDEEEEADLPELGLQLSLVK